MKRVFLFASFVCVSIFLHSINYFITFTGSGASTTVESVIVQNLTKGTTVTVPTGNVLNLSDVATSVDKVSDNVNGISVFPNPIQENATVSFYAKQTGPTLISAFSLDGRKIVSVNANLLQGNNSFTLSIPKGVYLLQVNGNGYSYNAKAISENSSNIIPQISTNSAQPISKPQKNKSAVTSMLYSSGDQLLYKGISGNYSTIVTDKPIASKTTDFEFIECKDGDGNYYPIVKIGTQVWMAENLKTTKYNDGNTIPFQVIVTPSDIYNWQYNTIGMYTTGGSGAFPYGGLYNWYTVITGKLSPLGWHVPTNIEWTTLSTYLGGELLAGGKLKETGVSHWKTPNTLATNETGFSALPGGYCFPVPTEFFNFGNWWSSTPNYNDISYGWALRYSNGSLGNGNYMYYCGLSIRCVKN